jgi:hypothetical protein
MYIFWYDIVIEHKSEFWLFMLIKKKKYKLIYEIVIIYIKNKIFLFNFFLKKYYYIYFEFNNISIDYFSHLYFTLLHFEYKSSLTQ